MSFINYYSVHIYYIYANMENWNTYWIKKSYHFQASYYYISYYYSQNNENNFFGLVYNICD